MKTAPPRTEARGYSVAGGFVPWTATPSTLIGVSPVLGQTGAAEPNANRSSTPSTTT